MALNHEWTMFLGGHWQKDMPQRAGEFYILDSDGIQLQHNVFWTPLRGCYAALGKKDVVWWWSEPIPDLPKPPPWGDAEVSR